MAYSDVAALSYDQDFRGRIAAAYITEKRDDPTHEAPDSWAQTNSWDMASAPGFGDAYASAVVAGNERPGNDPSVISDAQILSAVQAELA